MRLRSGRDKSQFAALLIPGILVFALFTVYPIVKLFVMSFQHWDLSSAFDKSFAGFENYKEVLTDKTFWVAFSNTLLYTLVTVPGQMILGLLAAMLIHSIPRFRVTFRVIYY
ncbi:MAG: sugar ABC transporter permease, partial [Clostridia bacterium]|nr:sugar ABC transporter permease [Clostridia bacterium]